VQPMTAHKHRCVHCGYVWQCAELQRYQPGHDICAICEALDRMGRGSGAVPKQGQEHSWRRHPHFVDRSGGTVR
jgi:hypothetical protein